jgi:hypothetical protein
LIWQREAININRIKKKLLSLYICDAADAYNNNNLILKYCDAQIFNIIGYSLQETKETIKLVMQCGL